MLRPEAVRWFQERRGISKETLEAFGVHSEGESTVFPYPGGAKKKRDGFETNGDPLWCGKPRCFTWDPPTAVGQVPFLPPEFAPQDHMFLLEGETDTMALWQNAPPEARSGIVGLSGLNAWKDEYAEELFGNAKVVFVTLDADDPYGNPQAYAQNQKARAEIRKALGRKVRTVQLPLGIKDVAEFFQRYGWSAFRVLLKAALEIQYPFKPLDLRGPMPEFEWLVKDLILKGDITMFTGEPGVGKSWLAQALAVSMAEGDPQWLGMDLERHGRVMYVDQENPLVTARHRLESLGLTDTGIDNMHYLWFQGVRFDQEPERILEHAELWQPDLIVFDSFGRFHFKNENTAEDMNPILNASVYPLARDLGATVVLIHHVPKEGKGPRGSGAIQAANDLTLEVQHQTRKNGTKTGNYLLVPDKLRNVPAWGSAVVFERREENGLVVIGPVHEEEQW